MSLELLLEWAKSVSAFIEIYADGSAEVQLGSTFDNRVAGRNLQEAIINARRYVGRWPQVLA